MLILLKFFHLAAAIVWLGGMTVMLFAVRPAMLAVLAGPERLKMQRLMLQRFFAMVFGAAVVLLLTGAHFFGAAAKHVGMSGIPLGWHLMLIFGVLMFLIFGHLYFSAFRGLSRAIDTGDMPKAAQKAGQIHKFVVINCVLGWLAVAAVKLL